MDPTMQEILSFLKEKSIFEDKDLIFMQEMLMGCEKNFKNELENAIRKVEERYKKMIAERVEDYKEKSQLLYERIDELKNEKSENEDKLRVYYEKFSELNDRVSRLVEEMGEIDEVEFNSAENCNGKSRNEGIDNINLVPTEKGCPADQSFQYMPSVCTSAKVDSTCNEQKESDHSDETDLEVETALQASGATGVNLKSNKWESSQDKDGVIDSPEMHFSHGPKSFCNSTGNSSGQSRHKEIDNINLVPTEKNCPGDQSFQCAPSACDSAPVESNSDKQKESDHSEEAGIDNINLVPTEKNCPGYQSFQCKPSACNSTRVESNSDKQKESDHSEEADPLPINLASECGDPTRHPSACKAVDRFKNNLNAASDKPESSPIIIISDSDDEMTTNEMACASRRCGLGVNLTCCPLKKEVHVQDSSNWTQKRKRSTNEGENSDCSSYGRQKTVLIPELVNDGNRSFVGDKSTNLGCSSKIARVVPFPEQNSVSIRRCEDKFGVKCHSELPPRRSDKPNVLSNGNYSDLDNDSCSTKKIEMFINEGRKCLSEDELCSAFEKNPELCLKAVCALYRQQISEYKSSYSMSQIDEMSITALGKCLIDGDPENKLRITMSEVSLKDHEKCKRLAIRYCHQLFQLYHSKRDRLFCPGAGIL